MNFHASSVLYLLSHITGKVCFMKYRNTLSEHSTSPSLQKCTRFETDEVHIVTCTNAHMPQDNAYTLS